jgi:hypothetical protein
VVVAVVAAVAVAVFIAVLAITFIEEVTIILAIFTLSFLLSLRHVAQAILFQSPSTTALSSLA